MISIGLPNGCEVLDNQLNQIFFKATHEDNIRDNIASYTTALTLGGLFIDRVHNSYYTNDGCIYRTDEGGARLIGLNESKFGNFKGSIAGSKLNSQFAQAVAYALKLNEIPEYKESGRSRDLKFFWLTSECKFHLVLVKENHDLLISLAEFYRGFDRVTPCRVYQMCGIDAIFRKNPLRVYRSFNINEDFKFSEFIKESLTSIDVPVTMFNGNNN